MKRDLEVLGIHQRDMARDEEVQLSLEQVRERDKCTHTQSTNYDLANLFHSSPLSQAFYIVVERQRLQVHLPGQPEPLGVLGCWRA